MKITAAAIVALPLLQVAIAQPHGAHRAHRAKHAKKDADVVVFTVIDTVYAEPTDFPIVYVDQFGAPLSTVTRGPSETGPIFWSTIYGVTLPVATPAESALILVEVPTSTSVVESQAPTIQAAPVVNVASTSSIPVPVASSTVAPVASSYQAVASAASSSSSTEQSGFGFAYSPYNADKSCKTQDQINTDFAKVGDGYSLVRTYGTDCNQTATILVAAKAHKFKLFAGIFSLDSLTDEVNLIINAANGDWSSFDTVSVGNELVNSGTASPSAVVAAIGTVRGLLKSAGYTGRVVTVDTLIATRSNPTLCDNSDYCAVNCHPFFDGTVESSGAGAFITAQIPTLRNVLANANQQIVITETGWPWNGATNGAAVPSPGDQANALSSIRSTFSSNPNGVILFSTFNTLWKSNSASEFGAEQYWGFLGNSPSG